MKLITLLTDFGLQDGYPGIMKGVIWGIAPEVQIADLTHSIPPQDILAGALALGRAAPYFPPGTIHVGVVDPGVGTRRRGDWRPAWGSATSSGRITGCARRCSSRRAARSRRCSSTSRASGCPR